MLLEALSLTYPALKIELYADAESSTRPPAISWASWQPAIAQLTEKIGMILPLKEVGWQTTHVVCEVWSFVQLLKHTTNAAEKKINRFIIDLFLEVIRI